MLSGSTSNSPIFASTAMSPTLPTIPREGEVSITGTSQEPGTPGLKTGVSASSCVLISVTTKRVTLRCAADADTGRAAVVASILFRPLSPGEAGSCSRISMKLALTRTPYHLQQALAMTRYHKPIEPTRDARLLRYSDTLVYCQKEIHGRSSDER